MKRFTVPYHLIRILGRSDGNSLFWTGSGLEFNLKGSEFSIELDAGFGNNEPWVALVLDGRVVLRKPLELGKNVINLRGFDPDCLHNVKLLRETQAMPDDPNLFVKIMAVEVEGDLGSLPETALKMEFIGDSLTSAEGSLGAETSVEWLPVWFSAAYGWPFLTGEKLGAEVRIISQSGWGVTASYDGNPDKALPKYYEQVCSVVADGSAGASHKPYDFGAWKADVVVCALGANDYSAIDGKEWGVDGKTIVKTIEDFKRESLEFLKKIRLHNPNALIVWVAFEGLGQIYTAIEDVMKTYQLIDHNIQFIDMPQMNWDTGARNHPNIDEHAKFADILAEKLQKLLVSK